VHDLSSDHEAQILVETILAMAQALRMVTVAEGVELPRQASLLAERGCSRLQGYLIGRPLPAHRVAKFIGEWQGLDAVDHLPRPAPASIPAPASTP
jgi:EAL domain-containing protein (putative c-di-GMP-specific phosphodiesterase class I)